MSVLFNDVANAFKMRRIPTGKATQYRRCKVKKSFKGKLSSLNVTLQALKDLKCKKFIFIFTILSFPYVPSSLMNY